MKHPFSKIKIGGLVMLCLLLAMAWAAWASTNSASLSTTSCDKKGTSGPCGPYVKGIPESTAYQAWSGDISAHAEGHGSFGGAGGKISATACLSQLPQMWSGSCVSFIENYDIGDGSYDLIRNINIGGDYGPDFNYLILEMYANDATWDPINMTVHGRRVSVEPLTAPASVNPNSGFGISWSTDNALGGRWLFWEGKVSCSGSSGKSIDASGSETCQSSSAGSGEITVSATGPGGFGQTTVESTAIISVASGGGGGGTPGAFNLNPLSCSGESDPTVSMDWGQSSGATSYEIWRCIWSSCDSNTKVDTVTGTSYSDSNPHSGWDYYYTIKAVNSSGSKSSNTQVINTSPQNCGGSPPPPGGGTTQCNPPLWDDWRVDACWDEDGDAICEDGEQDVADWWCVNQCEGISAASFTNQWIMDVGTKYAPTERECPGCDFVLTGVTCNVSPPATKIISGNVFVDTDEDGVRDGNESGHDGATITFRDADNDNQFLASKTTNNGGNYTWNDGPANHNIRTTLTIPPGYQATTDTSVLRLLDQNQVINFGIALLPPPPPGCSFSADPSRLVIPPPRQSTLSWSCTNATSCSIDQGVGGVATSDSTDVTPAQTTTYTLSCDGAGGGTENSATVSVYRFEGGSLIEIPPQQE